MSLVVENKRPVFTLFIITMFAILSISVILALMIYLFYKTVERDIPSAALNYGGGGFLILLATLGGLFGIVATVKIMVDKISK